MRHGDLLVAQTPSREIWFAGTRSAQRTSARTTDSRNPPWFLQPGWQTAPRCEARSLLMSCLYSKLQIYDEEAWPPIAKALMTRIQNRRLIHACPAPKWNPRTRNDYIWPVSGASTRLWKEVSILSISSYQVSRDLRIDEAKRLSHENKLMETLLITEHGKQNEELLGLVSRWAISREID